MVNLQEIRTAAKDAKFILPLADHGIHPEHQRTRLRSLDLQLNEWNDNERLVEIHNLCNWLVSHLP